MTVASTPPPIRAVVAASGTGGHLFPALYIAKAITALAPGSTVVFIGSGRPLEAKIIDAAGFKRYEVNTSGLRRLGAAGFLKWLRTLPRAIASVRQILRSEQPQIVIGVGGYVSVLPVLLARLKGIPTWVHEAEHEPGWANRFLARFVTKMSLAWADTDLPPQVARVLTGHPVRPELLKMDFSRLQLSSPPRVLILGGSQGARALDEGCCKLAPFFAQYNVSLWHQSRAESVDLVRQTYERSGVVSKVAPFIEEMAEALQWADIIISRSGAGAVREIEVSRRPAILVPLPEAVEQRYNAKVLQDKGQALIVEQSNNFVESLRSGLEQLLDSKHYAGIAHRLQGDAPVDAARLIAEECLSLANSGVFHRYADDASAL